MFVDIGHFKPSQGAQVLSKEQLLAVALEVRRPEIASISSNSIARLKVNVCKQFVLRFSLLALNESVQPASTQDHGQRQKQCKAGPSQPVQRCFSTAGAAEHGATAGGQATHAITLGAVQKHQDDQQKAGTDPAPGQD